MTPTLHFALVFGSIATYGAVQRMRFEHEGAVGKWHYRASVGQIPEGMRRVMAVRSGALESLLGRLTGQPEPTTSSDRTALRLATKRSTVPLSTTDSKLLGVNRGICLLA
jgi:hypothetical protein